MELREVRCCVEHHVRRVALQTHQNTITEDIALVAVSEGHSSNTFCGYDSISVEAAQILVEDSSDLYLDGIRTLSPEVAAVLSQHAGMVLSLSGLASINCELAVALSKHRGLLMLDGLKSLRPDVSEQLALHAGGLSVNGLKTLRLESAQCFATNHEDLSLNGLSTLSLDVAVCLVDAQEHSNEEQNRVAREIRDHGIPVPSEAAEVIDDIINRRTLSLCGLPSLEPALASVLATHHGILILSGLHCLDAEVIVALSQYKGPLLALDGVVSLSTQHEELLRQIPGALSMESLERKLGDDKQPIEAEQRRNRFMYNENDVELLFRKLGNQDAKGD